METKTVTDTTENKDTIEVIDNTPKESTSPAPLSDIPFSEGIAPYLAFLEAMRVTKKTLDTAPTFTPKNFYEQIQFYENGATYRIYIHMNGTWRYVALT